MKPNLMDRNEVEWNDWCPNRVGRCHVIRNSLGAPVQIRMKCGKDMSLWPMFGII